MASQKDPPLGLPVGARRSLGDRGMKFLAWQGVSSPGRAYLGRARGRPSERPEHVVVGNLWVGTPPPRPSTAESRENNIAEWRRPLEEVNQCRLDRFRALLDDDHSHV